MTLALVIQQKLKIATLSHVAGIFSATSQTFRVKLISDTPNESGSHLASALLLNYRNSDASQFMPEGRSANQRNKRGWYPSQLNRKTLEGHLSGIRMCVTQFVGTGIDPVSLKDFFAAISSGVTPNIVEEMWSYGNSGESRKRA